MTRFSQVFWIIAAIDAAMLAIFFVMMLQDRGGQNDGGREMGLFFFGMVPAAVLGIAMLLFHFSSSWPMKSIAMFIVIVPAIWLIKDRVDDQLIDRQIEANRNGTGYFESEAMKQMGAAVVGRDVATLMRVGPSVNINTRERKMTLMLLAVDSPEARAADVSILPVVKALLALGANPNEAMPVACMREDPALLKMLLAAGADPNLMVNPDQPLIFRVKSTVKAQNFRLLASHGLDLNSSAHGDPLVVQLTIYRRWDLLAIAIELGADLTPTRSDGRNVAGELESQIAEEAAAGREPPPQLLLARKLLESKRKSG